MDFKSRVQIDQLKHRVTIPMASRSSLAKGVRQRPWVRHPLDKEPPAGAPVRNLCAHDIACGSSRHFIGFGSIDVRGT